MSRIWAHCRFLILFSLFVENHFINCYQRIQASLKAFIQPEILEKSNQWLCSQCNKKVDAEKGLSLDVLPEILTLQLKVFSVLVLSLYVLVYHLTESICLNSALCLITKSMRE
jgi:ubiquitin C-terminal hydrolase